MSNKTKSKNNQELTYQVVLSYKVSYNYPLKTFLTECKDKLNISIDIIWNNIEYTKKGYPKLPKSNEFKRNLRNKLLENWNYAPHYIDGVIKTAYSVLESWLSNYKRGYRTKTKPKVERLFVRVKTTLIKYDKELHRLKEVYDKKIDFLKSLLKKCPLRVMRKIERLFERRRNRVKDFLHKLTIQLSRLFHNAIFVFEDLNKRKMYKNKYFNRK